MGHRNTKLEKRQSLNTEQIQKSIQALFGVNIKAYTLQNIISPIIAISKHISQNGSFHKGQDGFVVNTIVLRCIYHPQFQNALKALIILLGNQLKKIMDSRLIALVPRQKFKTCLNLAHFCIFFTDFNLLQTINLLGVRTDLHPNTKSLISQLSQDNSQLNLSIFNLFQLQQLSQLSKILRISLGMMIDLHLKILTRSDFTLKIVDMLNQSVFIVFCKIYFSSFRQLNKRQKNQNAKSLVKIGAYFLGLGLQNKIDSIYETAVILLSSVLQSCSENIKQAKALPSHLFKQLPVINSNQSIDWITYNLLYAMKYVKDGMRLFSKLNVNRIPSLKLLQLIFKKFKPKGQQITYMLEQLCLQTKPGQIERVYISQIVDLYAKLQNIKSQIILKYSHVKQVNYNVKSSKKSLKIRPQQIITELQNDDDTFQKEMNSLCSKYVSQVIFQKNDIVYEYSDKSLWNQILYNLETGSTHGGAALEEAGQLEQ